MNAADNTAVLAPSESLNKKRQARGNLPFLSYHVLALGGERSATTHLGGMHASPRQHLRRGHIRHLPTGRTTWVRSCVVGSHSTGRVVKDYRLRASSAS